MKLKHLHMKGFRSFQSGTLDFTPGIMAISGHNGAGKSSILDAVLWALYGDTGKGVGIDDIINTNEEVVEVTLEFEFEGAEYRVVRKRKRGGSPIVEFQIHNGKWSPLSEKNARDTQAKIVETLKMPADVFMYTTFLSQGGAGKFAELSVPERKAALMTMLGLEEWEARKEKAAELRKATEQSLAALQAKMSGMQAEIDELPARQARLEQLNIELEDLTSAAEACEKTVQQAQAIDQLLKQKAKAEADLDRAEQEMARIQDRLKEIQAAMGNADQIRSDAQERESLLEEQQTLLQSAPRLAELRQTAERLRGEITTEQRLIEQRMKELNGQFEKAREACEREMALADTESEKRSELNGLNQKLEELEALNEERITLEVRQKALVLEMQATKGNIEALETSETCPLCGGDIDAGKKDELIAEARVKGEVLKKEYDANQSELNQMKSRLSGVDRIKNRSGALSSEIASIQATRVNLDAVAEGWQNGGAEELSQIEKRLSGGNFATDQRVNLEKAQQEMWPLAASEARLTEVQARLSELADVPARMQALTDGEKAAQTLSTQLEAQQERADEYRQQIASIVIPEGITTLGEAEQALWDAREQTNLKQQEVGGAQQMVSVIDSLRKQLSEAQPEATGLQDRIAKIKLLEKAFSKDGIPSLILEQMVPSIEEQANRILDDLSADGFSIRFVTQEQFRSKSGLKETMRIGVVDGSGVMRDIATYSGGESFRINFAIRLAMSLVLAKRSGARMETLVIDEGFGSQDATGVARLLEAIRQAEAYFKNVVVVSHVPEVKDAFQGIVVERQPIHGSVVLAS